MKKASKTGQSPMPLKVDFETEKKLEPRKYVNHARVSASSQDMTISFYDANPEFLDVKKRKLHAPHVVSLAMTREFAQSLVQAITQHLGRMK